jgi:hypothetical protein
MSQQFFVERVTPIVPHLSMSIRHLLFLTGALVLAACTTPTAPQSATTGRPTPPRSPLDERYFDLASQNFEMPPPYGPRGNRPLANY